MSKKIDYDKIMREVAQVQGYPVDPEFEETEVPGLIDDGGFTRNVLMKGIPGMQDDSPSFTGINETAWMPDGRQVSREDLPPSPLMPEVEPTRVAPSITAKSESVENKPKVVTRKPASVTMPKPQVELPKVVQEEQPAPVEQPEAKASLLDKLLTDFNTPQRDTELDEAQKRRNEILRQLALLQGFNKIGAAIAQVKPQEDFLATQMQLASQPVKDIESRREQERKMKEEKAQSLRLGLDVERFKQDSEAKGIDLEKAKLQLSDAKANKDPNSDISKATREAILQRFGLAGAKINVPQGLSADQLRTMFPMGDIVDDLLKQKAMKESSEDRKQARKERDEQQLENKRQSLTTHISDKIKQYDDKIGYNKALSDYEMLKDRLATGRFDSVSDVAATYALMKALDPGSVVRESEFETLVKSQGGLEKIKQMPARFFKGDIYSPKFREKLVDQFNDVVTARRKQLAKVLEPDLKRAKELGIKEEHIISGDTTKGFDQLNRQPASVAEGAAAELARRRQGK